jgi:hypothetical protein
MRRSACAAVENVPMRGHHPAPLAARRPRPHNPHPTGGARGVRACDLRSLLWRSENRGVVRRRRDTLVRASPLRCLARGFRVLWIVAASTWVRIPAEALPDGVGREVRGRDRRDVTTMEVVFMKTRHFETTSSNTGVSNPLAPFPTSSPPSPCRHKAGTARTSPTCRSDAASSEAKGSRSS